MRVTIDQPQAPLPVERAWALSMTVQVFKGRRDVTAHLFRAAWDPAEENAYDWERLIGEPLDEDAPGGPDGSRRVLLEAFTAAERDALIDFLRATYADRLAEVSARPLDFPIPAGLTALSDARAGKAVGFIDFGRVPAYGLPLPLKALYDLGQHRPIIETRE